MNQRGGVVADIFIAIGVIVVFAAVAGVACGACASGASPARGATATLVQAHHDQCDPGYEDCRDDDGHNQHRGNFSPGPFDRSPVDARDMIHDNTVCISLDCSGGTKNPTTTTTGPKRPASVACLVPAPWHCDQRRAS
jgi:hypothetical protein